MGITAMTGRDRMSITFMPTQGCVVGYEYHSDETEGTNGIVRFEQQEPSCNAHNYGGFAIQRALGIAEPSYVGTIQNSKLALLEYDIMCNWPAALARYQTRMLQVVRCAMYHGADVSWS
jgi:hypothetical protein